MGHPDSKVISGLKELEVMSGLRERGPMRGVAWLAGRIGAVPLKEN